MNRKETIKFINDEILPTAEISNDDWFYMGKEIMQKIIKGISKYRHGKPISIEMSGEIKDGVLYINGECIARVAPKLPRKSWDEKAYYIESLILEQQEIY